MSRLVGVNWGELFVDRTDEWLTPPFIVTALGDFGLDPCTPLKMPWKTAERRYTVADDGLLQPWKGRVWLNPPYSNVGPWMQRMAQHNHGTALVFARTETGWWFDHVWYKATAALWIRGRVTFHTPDGSPSKLGHSTSPSVLVAFGEADAEVLADAASSGTITGRFIYLNRAIRQVKGSYPTELAG